MKRKVEGTCLMAEVSKSTTPIRVVGSEYCTQANMNKISGIINACGFTTVVSHHASSIDLGDGTNVLAIYNSAMSRIVNVMRMPKSVIVAPTAVTGGQLDTMLKLPATAAACKDAIKNEYRDKSGAIIVGGGRVLGIYCTARNLLVTTDLTHCANGPLVVAQILTELLKYKAHYKINGSDKIIVPFKKKEGI